MERPGDQDRAAVFDEVAELYDAVRPGYPAEAVDWLLAHAGLAAGDRVLEIGCGTGQLTEPLGRRGLRVTALDRGARLCARARARCASCANVDVVQATFEAWSGSWIASTGQPFDLVVAAQAFHWIEPADGVARAAELLGIGAHLVLVWNLDCSQHTAFWEAMTPVYARFMPATGDAGASFVDKVERSRAAIVADGRFDPLESFAVGWRRRYAGADYLALLDTYSDHRSLPEPRKAALFREIARCIATAGGTVERFYETRVVAARRR